jgi:hypothetical protein
MARHRLKVAGILLAGPASATTDILLPTTVPAIGKALQDVSMGTLKFLG